LGRDCSFFASVIHHASSKRCQVLIRKVELIKCWVIKVYQTGRRGRLGRGGGAWVESTPWLGLGRRREPGLNLFDWLWQRFSSLGF